MSDTSAAAAVDATAVGLAHQSARAEPQGNTTGEGVARQLATTSGQDGRLTMVTWTAAADLDKRHWATEGRRIGLMVRCSPWWIGDWLLYGTARWGDRYGEAARITGLDRKTLRNMRYVSSRVGASLRRDALSWSHHALVAALSVDEQAMWLDRAVRDRLSVDDLRVEMRAARNAQRPTLRETAAPVAPTPDGRLTCPKCGSAVPMQPTGE
jgi:hypothetical protein